jgi:hypothetical protein
MTYIHKYQAPAANNFLQPQGSMTAEAQIREPTSKNRQTSILGIKSAIPICEGRRSLRPTSLTNPRSTPTHSLRSPPGLGCFQTPRGSADTLCSGLNVRPSLFLPGATLISPQVVETLLRDRHMTVLLQPFRLALLRLASQVGLQFGLFNVGSYLNLLASPRLNGPLPTSCSM